jgi:hypothetical protein
MTTDTQVDGAFPPPPVAGTPLLDPIASWAEMHAETKMTGVEFDAVWYDNVEEGVAYFFRWIGEPRATVLVVWDHTGVTFIECRKTGDLLVSESESKRIRDEVIRTFGDAGFFSRSKVDH